MTWTTRQLVTVVSIIFLILVMAFACYGMYLIQHYSLPIPYSLGAFSILLPALGGVAIESSEAVRRRKSKQGRGKSRPLTTLVAFFVLTVYETVLVTLAGTHIAPVDELNCGLETRWQTLFRNKDASAIRRIQDSFFCCGLRSPVDKAWPFPDKNHDQHSCERTLDRSKSCFSDWRGQEQRTAAIFLMVPILVFVWKLIVVAAPGTRSTWLNQIQDQIPGAEADFGRGQQSIDYPNNAEQYSDEPRVREIEESPEQLHDVAARRAQDSDPVLERARSTGDVGRGPSEWDD